MKKLFRYKYELLGLLLGAIGGYLYWDQIGCVSGSCPITSTWERMVPYGALMGGLLGGMVADLIDKSRKSEAKK
jgi:hypothetical protein